LTTGSSAARAVRPLRLLYWLVLVGGSKKEGV
jgi:hypothetical protein